MLKGFPPIYDSHAQLLILGSMPSTVSLDKREYYGFKLNRFWKIMSSYTHRELATYDQKVQLLHDHHIALWDVIAGCEREGSLDSKIKHPICNDIHGLLKEVPSIKTIICNGRKAAELYDRHFKAAIALPVFYLPSTSNANRTIQEAALFEAWLTVLTQNLGDPKEIKR